MAEKTLLDAKEFLQALHEKVTYEYRPAVAVDLDGVIFEYNGHKGPDHYGKPLPGVKEFLQALRDMGIRIIIHTARVNEVHPRDVDLTAAMITEVLWKQDLEFDEVWTGRGKPIALAYIDDRAFFINADMVQRKPGFWDATLDAIHVAKLKSDANHAANPGEIAE